MTAYEKDIKDLIQQMQMQSSGMPNQEGNPQSSPSPFSESTMGGTDQSPHLSQSSGNLSAPDQSPANPINSVRPMGTPINNEPPQPAGMKSAGGCPQCGLMHPPVAGGGKCPLAPVKVKDGDKERIIDVNKFLGEMKNIILSQAEKREIKDIEKLFKNIIVEITKYIEGYNE